MVRLLASGTGSCKTANPLGGTSNHFDIMKLKQIGAWDPFNVTEDADLASGPLQKDIRLVLSILPPTRKLIRT